jgi:hypothetical protein
MSWSSFVAWTIPSSMLVVSLVIIDIALNINIEANEAVRKYFI